MIADPVKPLLQYAIGSTPFPLHVNDADGASLQVMASNNTGETVKLLGIAIQFPVGDTSTDLSGDGYFTAVAPDGWRFGGTSPIQGGMKYLFEPENNDTFNLPAQSTLSFFFNDVTINATPGIAEILVTEGSAAPGKPSPVDNLYLSKFPQQWGNVTFTSDQPWVNANGSTVLRWKGPGGSSATYKISYTTPLGGPVTVPADGQPPFSNDGAYTTPNLSETTTFTLIVLDEIDGKTYAAFAQVTVPVVMAKPVITQFTGRLSNDANGFPQLVVNWQTTGASCTISGDNNTYGQNSLGDKFVISFSAEKPLLSTYTLTAQNDLGSATSTIQVNWALASNGQIAEDDLNYSSALSPDGSRLYVASFNTVCIYDTQTYKQVGNTLLLSGEVVPPCVIAISPDGKKLFISYTDSAVVQIVNISGDTLTLSQNQITGLVTVMKVSADSSKLYVLSMLASMISVYDIRSDVPIHLNSFTHANVFDFSLTADEQYMYVITNDYSQSYLFRLTTDTFTMDLQPFLLPSITGGIFAAPDNRSVLVTNFVNQVFSVYQPEEHGIYSFSHVNDFNAAPAGNYIITSAWISADSYYAFVMAAAESGNATMYIYNMIGQTSNSIPLTLSGEFMPGIQLPLLSRLDGTLLVAYIKNTTYIWIFKPVSVSGGVSSSNFSIAGQQQQQQIQ